ncbi:signal peptidase I [Paenibacillus sp. J31TS4]|uniref:signal peptidase I n=1 Tax=Paenibacillus sp. J31TS4 TaxID=2807195 RepID=UPI001B0A6994|nr:signal peptidase I [Paenibacillus sp. J31TS4]GIP37385.1 signal peptidase I [Paenibacillus sp. J31TS4]
MKVWKEVWHWGSSLGIAFLLAMLIGVFVFQPTKVSGHSMDPTLRDNERVFVSKLSHTFSYEPDYNDIVILDSRVDRERTFRDDVLENGLLSLLSGKADEQIIFIKRVIGKAGDEIEFKDHKVYRNGEPLDEPYLNEPMTYTSSKKWVVPEGHVFVLGDNRNHSLDSRDIGYIPLSHVLGKKM